jgi:hypothetical protein
MSYNLQPGSWPWDPEAQARRARFRRPDARRRLFSRLGDRWARSARRRRKAAA